MIRNLSWMCFGLAFSSALLLSSFAVPQEWGGWAVGSVLFSVLLTHLFQIRSLGLIGVAGLILVIPRLEDSAGWGIILLSIAIVFIVIAVILAFVADFSVLKEEKYNP
ncbi:MAG: hypothetical protein JEZ00_19585 [Anaerolineaceae bacterium]|nr:hypothetical protein [Anaerolineaceae bacterium]